MVGLCAIGALAGISSLLLRFGELTKYLERTYEVRMRANAAMGLRGGSQVLLEGVPIGEVERIGIEPMAPLPVTLTLTLQQEIPLPSTARATISAGLLGGGTKIDFRIPDDAPGTPIDPANPPVFEARFTSIADQIEGILTQVNSGEGTVGRLLRDPKLYDDAAEAAQRLSLTLRDLQALVRRVKEEGLELKF